MPDKPCVSLCIGLFVALLLVLWAHQTLAEEPAGGTGEKAVVLDQDLPEVEDKAHAYLADIEKRLARLETRLKELEKQVELYDESFQQEYAEALQGIENERNELSERIAALEPEDPDPATVDSINEQLAELQQAYDKALAASEKGKRHLICRRLLYLFSFCQRPPGK